MADLTGILPPGWEAKKKKDMIPKPPEEQIQIAMAQAGFQVPDHIAIDGDIHRFKNNGKDKSGWYVFFPDKIVAGTFGDWRECVEHNFCANIGREFSQEEAEENKRRIAQAKERRRVEREKQYKAQAKSAEYVWDKAPDASDCHPYLLKKGIKAHGLRLASDGRLLAPLYNKDGELCSLQYIDHAGGKYFFEGGKTGEAFTTIGHFDGGLIYVAEGFATAATIYEATSRPVVVAYSASNIPKVVEIFHDNVKKIVIVADNDKGGVGQNYADQACAKFGCTYVMPPIQGMDANDYAQAGNDLLELLQPKTDNWLTWADDFCQDFKAINWLVKGWIPRDSAIMLFGPSGTGKTFLILDWCLRIASRGQISDWHGRKVRHGVVVYLAGEGHYGLKGRIRAWRQHNDYDGPLDVIISRSGCDLNTPSGYQRVVDGIDALGVEPALIVVDTLHRFFEGDENSAKDSRSMINACTKLQHRYKSCSTALIHHTGVAGEKRARGSASWKGAMEVELSLSHESEAIALECTKGKDTKAPEKTYFDLESVPLNGCFDEDGEQVTSAVIVQVDEPEKESKSSKKLNDFEKAWFRSGAEIENNMPYVSRSAMLEYLVSVLDLKESTAQKHLKPSVLSGTIGELMSNGLIEPFLHGWVLLDNIKSSAMIMAKNAHKHHE